MTQGAQWRLSLMMFLEYAIWGSWLPLLARYLDGFLHFTSGQIGWLAFVPACSPAEYSTGQLHDETGALGGE